MSYITSKLHLIFGNYWLQASGPSPKSKKPPSKPVASSGGGGKKGGETKKNGKQTGNGEVSEDDSASASSTPKKGAKDTSRKRKTEESSPALTLANQESPACVKRAKTARDNNRDLGLCRYVLLACCYLSFCYKRLLCINFLFSSSCTKLPVSCFQLWLCLNLVTWKFDLAYKLGLL